MYKKFQPASLHFFPTLFLRLFNSPVVTATRNRVTDAKGAIFEESYVEKNVNEWPQIINHFCPRLPDYKIVPLV